MAYKLTIEIMAEDRKAVEYFMRLAKTDFIGYTKGEEAGEFTNSDCTGSSNMKVEEID